MCPDIDSASGGFCLSLGSEAPPYIIFGLVTAILALIYQMLGSQRLRGFTANEINLRMICWNIKLSSLFKIYLVAHATVQCLILIRLFVDQYVEWRNYLDLAIKIVLTSTPILLITFVLAVSRINREIDDSSLVEEEVPEENQSEQ